MTGAAGLAHPLIVSSEVLFRELESRQTALRHFIQYLSETGQQKVLLQLLGCVSGPRTADPPPPPPPHID